MPKTKRLLAATAAAALLVATAAGQAIAGPAEKVARDLRTEQVWFTCTGATGVAQLDGASTWSAEAPADGDGCGSLDTGYHAASAEDTTADTVFHGSFTGNLDNLTVRLHLERLVEGDGIDIAVGLAVDGAEKVPWPTAATVYRTEETPPGVVEFSLHRIGLLDTADNAPHDLTLTVSLRGALARGAWRWGSAGTPSGITFHPHHLADTVVRASDDTTPPPDDSAAAPVGPAVVAGPGSQTIGFLTPRLATAPDTTLRFANTDQIAHDVTSRARDAAGKPLFRSPVTATGGISAVAGADQLPPGSYDFYCSLHPNMTGTLQVAGALPGPHGGG